MLIREFSTPTQQQKSNFKNDVAINVNTRFALLTSACILKTLFAVTSHQYYLRHSGSNPYWPQIQVYV